MEDSNNDWTIEFEQKEEKILKKAKTYKKMHRLSFKKASLINKILSITSILLVTIVASGSLGTIFVIDTLPFSITSAIILYIVAIINSLKDFLGIADKPGEHKVFETKFSSLANSIEKELAVKREKRENPENFYKWTSATLDNFIYFQPEINPSIFKKYKDEFNTTFSDKNTETVPEQRISVENSFLNRELNKPVK